MARSTARKRALNTLYEADEKGQDILSLLAERLERPGAQTPLPAYAVDIVRGVAGHARVIDRLLNDHSTGWRVPRMAAVDRNILRMAVWEIVYNDEVPDGVAIDEALTLAKTLSDDDSPAFIHGLLNAVASDDDARTTARETEAEGSPSAAGVTAAAAESIPQDSATKALADIQPVPIEEIMAPVTARTEDSAAAADAGSGDAAGADSPTTDPQDPGEAEAASATTTREPASVDPTAGDPASEDSPASDPKRS
nr:transcription antitermination factor NusB [uncultured Bifidobacterium sp.]